MIEICNLKNTKPEHPWDFGIHRRTPIGNPYFMENPSKRNQVCDQYDDWFHHAKHNKGFHDYLATLVSAYKEHGKLRLFCWCAPKRCHGETIKQYIEEQ